MQKRLFPVYFLLLFIFFSCSQNQKVIVVGNYHIDLNEFKELVKNDRYAPKNISQAYLLDKAQKIADNEIMLYNAKKDNYDELPSIVKAVKNTSDQAIYMEVIEKDILDAVLPESFLLENYNRNSKQYKLSHIMLHKSSDSKVDEARIQQLKDARSTINGEEAFGKLAKEISKDSLTANRFGSMGVIKWGHRDFGDDFYTAVSKLKVGRISNVTESKVGYHLLFLKEVKDVEQIEFDKVRDAIRQSLIPQYTDSLNSIFYSFIDALEERYNVQYHEEAMAALLTKIENAGDNDPNSNPKTKMFIETLADDEKELELASFDNGQFSVLELLNVYASIRPDRRPKLQSIEKIQEMLSRNISRKLVIQYGYDERYDIHAPVVDKVEAKRSELMVQYYKRDKFVRPVVSPQDVETFYNENIDNYQDGIKMNVQEIFVNSLEEAKDIQAKLTAGGNFDILAERFNTRPKTKDNKGMLGWISPRQYSAVGRTANNLKVGEISDPIRLGKNYSIIQVLDRTFENYKELSTVEGAIRQQLYSQKEEIAYREWIEELAHGLQVSINENLIIKEFGIDQAAN